MWKIQNIINMIWKHSRKSHMENCFVALHVKSKFVITISN